MKSSALALILILHVGRIAGQIHDIAAIWGQNPESVSYLLFEKAAGEFRYLEAFEARSLDLAPDHPRLLASGDFTGSGVDELAIFSDLAYTPNMNPDFTCSVISISRSAGEHFVPLGSWFSTLKSDLDFDHVAFSVAGDFNQDGYCDIALFCNDPSVNDIKIGVLESTGSGFSEMQTWYTTDRNEFNFTALKFACAGDYNGNGKPDIAVFYDYFGTSPETRQAIFLFESEGDSFSLLPVAYETTRAGYDFSAAKFACSGDYNLDGFSDIAVLLEEANDQDLLIPVFIGSAEGNLSPVDYITFTDMEPYLDNVEHAVGGQFEGDSAADLLLFYDNPGTGSQEIILLESDLGAFREPETVFSIDPASLSLTDISAIRSGHFFHQPLVSVATWKNEKQGAISFTFDDGYRGAFEHGGAELEAAGLKGTYYIFSDTSEIYDGELASTDLIREYKNLGHEIASHTVNHSNLGYLTESGDVDSLNEVLSASYEVLNKRFDQYTMTMSIPFGSFRYETLDYISRYFYSGRSSQFGFNLATPYDYYALKSWPVLSTTSPAFVDNLLSIAENHGTYLPLMYHDMVDEPFDEESLIYTYSRNLFSQTLQDAMSRDLWIDTHGRIYKYIRERNGLKILNLDTREIDSQPGQFSFEAEDGLADSIFNVELTLRISIPGNWTEDTISIGPEGDPEYREVRQDSTGSYILYDWLPAAGISLKVYEGKLAGTGFRERPATATLNLNAAPNPFIHETLVSLSGEYKSDGMLVVRDLHGRIVKEIDTNADRTYRLVREELPDGVYILQYIQSGITLAAIKIIAL